LPPQYQPDYTLFVFIFGGCNAYCKLRGEVMGIEQTEERIVRLVLAHTLLLNSLPAGTLIPLRNELLQRIGASEG